MSESGIFMMIQLHENCSHHTGTLVEQKSFQYKKDETGFYIRKRNLKRDPEWDLIDSNQLDKLTTFQLDAEKGLAVISRCDSRSVFQ